MKGVDFWLKDYFSQKVLLPVLPTQYREGQKSYFGKKGMSLHVDVFFHKYQNQVFKKTYFTAMTRCDQGLTDVLAISDVVIKEFKRDVPSIMQLYAKSDNAGCYHANGAAEGLHYICNQHGLKLLRYDYNEPSKGKDQCDRDSAAAKTVLRSYVDAGNDIQSAEDIYNGLHYASGVCNAKVGVIEIDRSKTEFLAQDVPGIMQYHSFEFNDNHIKFWRYFDVGEGVAIPYSKKVIFVSGAVVIKPFSSTSSNMAIPQNNKKRISREISHLIFCTESDTCHATFDTVEKYNIHLEQGCNNVNIDTSMDKIRSKIFKHMKTSSMTALPSNEVATLDTNMSVHEASTRCLFFKELNQQGWALHERRKFRFDKEQLCILIKLFNDGERTGRKVTPEQAEREIRKRLSTNQYVTAQQIRSLFSRWSRQLRNGTLNLEENEEIIEEKDER